MEWIWLLFPLLSDTFSPTTTPNQNRYNNIDSCLFKWSYPCLFKVSPTHNCKCKERRIAFLNQIESTHSTILFFCTWWSNMKCEGGCCSGGRFEETETGWAEECGVWASHHNYAPPPLSPLNTSVILLHILNTCGHGAAAWPQDHHVTSNNKQIKVMNW